MGLPSNVHVSVIIYLRLTTKSCCYALPLPWNFQHALDATLRTCSWNFQHLPACSWCWCYTLNLLLKLRTRSDATLYFQQALDATLRAYSWKFLRSELAVGTSNMLLMLRPALPLRTSIMLSMLRPELPGLYKKAWLLSADTADACSRLKNVPRICQSFPGHGRRLGLVLGAFGWPLSLPRGSIWELCLPHGQRCPFFMGLKTRWQPILRISLFIEKGYVSRHILRISAVLAVLHVKRHE